MSLVSEVFVCRVSLNGVSCPLTVAITRQFMRRVGKFYKNSILRGYLSEGILSFNIALLSSIDISFEDSVLRSLVVMGVCLILRVSHFMANPANIPNLIFSVEV